MRNITLYYISMFILIHVIADGNRVYRHLHHIFVKPYSYYDHTSITTGQCPVDTLDDQTRPKTSIKKFMEVPKPIR